MRKHTIVLDTEILVCYHPWCHLELAAPETVRLGGRP